MESGDYPERVSLPEPEQIGDTTLINILCDDNNMEPNLTKVSKRKQSSNHKEAPRKKLKKGDEAKTRRLKCQRAKIRLYTPPKFSDCGKFTKSYYVRRHAKRVLELDNFRHRAVVSSAKICSDSHTVRNVKIKEEIVDLTTEDNSLYVDLKFAKTNVVPEEVCLPLFEIAKSEIVPEYLFQADTHQIEYYNAKPALVDLTLDDNNTDIISQRAVIDRILPVVYKCYKLDQAINKIEAALAEAQDITKEEGFIGEINFVSKMLEKRTNSGIALLQKLSQIEVANFNFRSFIENICIKLEEEYSIAVSPESLATSLNVTTESNSELVIASNFGRRFIFEVSNFINSYKQANLVFSEAQLEQLQYQINKYFEIAQKQKELIREYCIAHTDVFDRLVEYGIEIFETCTPVLEFPSVDAHEERYPCTQSTIDNIKVELADVDNL